MCRQLRDLESLGLNHGSREKKLSARGPRIGQTTRGAKKPLVDNALQGLIAYRSQLVRIACVLEFHDRIASNLAGAPGG